MKFAQASIALFFAFVFFFGCSSPKSANTETLAKAFSNSDETHLKLDINSATVEELKRLPHVGEKLASRIVEYREVHGRFRRIEHLILVSGFSDAKFREIRGYIQVK